MKNSSSLRLALTMFAGGTALFNARADIQLRINLGASLWESGITGGYAQSDDAIGIYAFSTSGSTVPIAPTIYSVCLSPQGLLDYNPHQYTAESFASASPGIFPSSWVSGNVNGHTQYWGIANAAYLWATFGMNIVDGHTTGSGLTGNGSEQGCALQFAIWNVLYNSTGYGASTGLNGVGGSYSTPFSQLDAAEQQDYNTYLNALLAEGSHMPLYTGEILEGNGAPHDGPNGGDDQEFFLLGAPTPEPSTVIAGALMLVPLGASALRKFRKGPTPTSSEPLA